MVALGGFLAQASKTTLTNTVPRLSGEHDYNKGRSVITNRVQETKVIAPISYLFSTSVSDPARGFYQSRLESRSQDGQVKGEYSYMDGFYKVKVVYTAGPNGFRVVRQERTPLKVKTPSNTKY